jgi:4-oxalocrotonate tautomerase
LRERKERVIKGITDVLATELDKDPALTFVVIEEVSSDDWGVAGESVTTRRAKGAVR